MVNKSGSAQRDVIIGGSGNDLLYGLGGRDLIKGLAGNDLLDGGRGDDDLRGGAGNDTYVVDHREDITRRFRDPGIDLVKASVSYTLGAQQENLILTGKHALNGTGNRGANVLTGNSGNNLLRGGDGDDQLDGVGGRDTLVGGNGNDTYTIHRAGEIRTATLDRGFDRVFSSVSYTLGAQQEDLYLLGKLALDAAGNDGNNRLTGNLAANHLVGGGGDDLLQGANGNDVLHGGAGNDVLLGGNGADLLFGGADNDYLDGGAGSDRYEGGTGNDQYLLGSIDELDKLAVDPGIDKVGVAFTYQLGDQQEDLFLLGNVGLTGTGNSHDNQLFGSAGSDLLLGLAGDDYLDGGDGLDSLIGGAGNDVYILREAGEISLTQDDPGIDEVRTSLTYSLGVGQENLVLAGSLVPISGNGNDSDNILVGNEGGNVLHGHGGDDELRGGGGADSLFGEAGADILHYQADLLVADGGADIDTLQIGSDVSTLDLGLLPANLLRGIETIALTGSANHTLSLRLADLLALSDSSDTLNIVGHAGDTVSAIGQGWQPDGAAPVLSGGHLYTAYAIGNAHLLVETEITQLIS